MKSLPVVAQKKYWPEPGSIVNLPEKKVISDFVACKASYSYFMITVLNNRLCWGHVCTLLYHPALHNRLI